jgi:uncharacterized protein HemY
VGPLAAVAVPRSRPRPGAGSRPAGPPDDPSLCFDLGRTLAHSRDFPEAADVLTAAIQENPSNEVKRQLAGMSQ